VLKERLHLIPSNFCKLKGELQLEKSKSIANRALIIQALSSFSFDIDDVGLSDDVIIMQSALQSGKKEINVGMAGTALRFLLAAFCVISGEKIIDGHARIRERPIEPLIKALKSLGAKISFTEGNKRFPVLIEGGFLDKSEVTIEQSVSSQFISALMLIAPFLPNGLKILRESGGKSESYVLLSKQIMEEMGLVVEFTKNEILIPANHVSISSYSIESDWSAAAYWMGFVLLIPNASITLLGLREKSKQGDRQMLHILEELGLEYKWELDKLHLFSKDSFIPPTHFRCDCSQIPDQAQTLAFLCSAMGIKCDLTGLETLKYKETNRIIAIKNELEKVGLVLSTTDDSISIRGKINVDKVEIETHNDHRMAMSAALLATQLEVDIVDSMVVKKSYPQFWSDLEILTSESATGK
jgi:3-phosphoshikimate 1-carboxyvinyltransferase